jgi:hypothetical protein
MRERMQRFLCGLRLEMHPGKSRVYRAADGVTFLGWQLFPDCARLARENVVRFRRRMRRLELDRAQGKVTFEEVRQRVRAWIAHADHGDTWRLRQRLLGRFTFAKGRAV